MAIARSKESPETSRRKGGRRDQRRGLILKAAREVFESEGLEGASIRAIAARAGYTAAALYFYFDSKEAVYAELLRISLSELGSAVNDAVSKARSPETRLRAAAMAFYQFYADNPRDLDLGFYLFRGGMKPVGLGRERDKALNAALEAALHPIASAAEALGASRDEANLLMVDVFAHASGLLLLLHTGRIRMFGASASGLMEDYIRYRTTRVGK